MSNSILLSGLPHEDLLPAPEEMSEFDRFTIQSGTPSIQLMKRAGKAVHAALQNAGLGLDINSRVVVLCGPGNNGGDGFVIAKELMQEGIHVELILSSAGEYSDDLIRVAAEYFDEGGGIHIFGSGSSFPIESNPIGLADLSQILSSSDIVIDSLLGTGQREAPRGNISELLCHVHTYAGSSIIVAVDIPTGVNADTGEAYSPGLSADLTICIELVKRGMTQYPARSVCGEIIAVAIGIDCSPGCEYRLSTKKGLPELPPRNPASHKRDFGSVLVIGGCADMPGAPILTANAALYSGSGLVRVAVPASDFYPRVSPELMLISDVGAKGYFELDDLERILPAIASADSIVCGPGLSQHTDTKKFLLHLLSLLEDRDVALVLDADALNLIQNQEGVSMPQSTVLTPHPGEMSRLLGIQTAEVQSNRFLAAKTLANKYQATVVLKGASSVIHTGYQGAVNDTGNPHMATAGSGDVLSGLIASFIAQGLDCFEATQTATYMHGLAGDIAHGEKNGPIVASDLISALSETFAICNESE